MLVRGWILDIVREDVRHHKHRHDLTACVKIHTFDTIYRAVLAALPENLQPTKLPEHRDE